MPDLADRLNAALAGRYVIQRELGTGGMATVFLAQDLKHRRSVAIKVLRPELAAAIGSERFLHEIETTAALNHPHILPLHDSGSADDLLFYVMPYVEGESLRARLERERQLPIRDALRLAGHVASALDYAHRQGVIHRDIKPENILLIDGQAAVADFGIARAVAAAGIPRLTATGITIGTPMYMSPEQAIGSETLDGRSDVYSLACVLYEMLAGQPPFIGPIESLPHQHLNVAPRPVSALRTTVPDALDRALETALAKVPADRFASIARFAEALAIPAQTAPRTQERRARIPRPAAIAVLVAGVVVIAVAVWSQWARISTWFRPAPPAQKEWVMIAEFDGPPDEPALTGATRDLVMAALDESSRLATVSPDQIQTALRLADKPPGTRVDAPLARELAYRKGIRAVVEGRITRLGAGSAIVVRVLDVERDSLVLSVSDVASDEKGLIPAIERVGRRIREGLGERTDAIHRSRELAEVRTSSFEAFKAYREGVRLMAAGDTDDAIAQFRAAIDLDRDFAQAVGSMGYAFFNKGQVDSASAAWRRALSRPERLSDRGRLMTEASVADAERDFPLALAKLDRILQQEPTASTAHSNRAWLLYRTGQYDAALASVERAVPATPFGPNQITILNRFYPLLALGRLDEARATARQLAGGLAPNAAPLWLATAVGSWALAESLGTAFETSPTSKVEMRRLGALAVASAAAVGGRIHEAERALRRAERAVGAATRPWARVSDQAAPRARLLLAMVTGGVPGEPESSWPRDTTIAAMVTRGLWAASAGDTLRAGRLLREVRSRPAVELAWAGADPELLEAWLAGRKGRWDEVVRTLGPAARQGSEVGFGEDRAGRVTLRWMFAQAHENLGHADSAAYYLEALLSPLGRVDQEYLSRGIAYSFAHCRLVLLNARMGRIDDARRHWQMLVQAVRTPDPEIEPLIAEARAALTSAEGIAKSTGR